AAPPAPSRIAAAIAWRSRGVVVLNSVEFMVASSVIVILLFLSVFADCIDVPIIDLVTIPAVVIRILQVSIRGRKAYSESERSLRTLMSSPVLTPGHHSYTSSLFVTQGFSLVNICFF